ncbi:MAG: biotin carboxyl carrier domain-containing protein [Armatimonadetes bacterium]|nr:biotin carboxyl carrier domain-containing protein [Armatimonadota bacterium]
MNQFPEAELVERLLGLMRRYDLESLEVEDEGLKIRVRAPAPLQPPSWEPGEEERYPLWPGPFWPVEEDAPRTEGVGDRSATARPLLAPLTGTFYRASKPDQPPFVETGDTVEIGQVVGIIEAMKVFSEVPSELSGVVVEVVARNGAPIQHGDVLYYVETSAP